MNLFSVLHPASFYHYQHPLPSPYNPVSIVLLNLIPLSRPYNVLKSTVPTHNEAHSSIPHPSPICTNIPSALPTSVSIVADAIVADAVVADATLCIVVDASFINLHVNVRTYSTYIHTYIHTCTCTVL